MNEKEEFIQFSCQPPHDMEALWQQLTAMQGQIFYTVKKLPFTYTIKGGEIFVDRRKKSITYATCRAAFERITACPAQVRGPKALNVFGAPYLWSLFQAVHLTAEDRGGE